MGIVAGVAIDKGKAEKYAISVDIIQVEGGSQAKRSSKILSVEGATLFEAVRKMISLTGKRLYWSHAKIVLISKQLAQDGITDILDWYTRDSETRPEIHILISKEKTASCILHMLAEGSEIASYQLDETLKNEKSLELAPQIDIMRVISDLQSEGISVMLPAIRLYADDEQQQNESRVPQISGAAVFKQDRLLGFLNETDTNSVLYLKNKISGGILKIIESTSDGECPVTLEIFKCSTKLELDLSEAHPIIKADIKLLTAIDEIGCEENFIEKKKQEKLKHDFEQSLSNQLLHTLEKVQSDFDADVFGFGSMIHKEHPAAWKRLKKDWDQEFKALKLQISVAINIKNSAVLTKTIKKGD